MAVDTCAPTSSRSRAEVAAERDPKMPLRRRIGIAWDVTSVGAAGRLRRDGAARSRRRDEAS
jgi:hypothetical protein